MQAFRLAEELSLPVMVCMDGFVLTHAFEPVDLPGQAAVDAFLPPFVPRQVLDPDHPVTIGAMVGPEAFTEVKYLAHLAHGRALERIPATADDFEAAFGRRAGGLVQPYRCAGAHTIVVALGSVLGTIAEVVDELREAGEDVGALGITTFRPWPEQAIREALAGAERVVVIDRALAPGVGGVVSRDVRLALEGGSAGVRSVIAGLGGRAITRRSLRRLFADALADRLDATTFLDLDLDLVAAAGS